MADSGTAGVRWVQWAGLVAGPILALAAYFLLPGATFDDAGQVVSGLTPGGRATTAVAILMATWWLTEAIDLSVTALLPLVLFPLLSVRPIRDAAAPYASPVIFLFMGGFILGQAMQRWGLHRRIALITILLVGTRPKRLVAGVMAATALMSMWVSNTATTAMMLPIGISVIHLAFGRLGREYDPNHPPPPQTPGANFATALMLGIAYAASIGGLGTLIGTPPLTVLKGFVEAHYGVQLPFARWLLVGVPIVALCVPAVWFYLTTIAFPIRLTELPGGRELIAGELRALGRMSRGEWAVFIVFMITAMLWIFRPLIARLGGLEWLSDEGIAMIAAVSLFLIPVHPRRGVFVMDWKTAEGLPWGILLLFGGGLSLAGAITATGVDAYLGRLFEGLYGVPTVLIILGFTLVMVFVTELTSNTAMATTMMPVAASAAVALRIDPTLLLLAAAIMSSLSFMLPVATPPNAMVFGTGYVSQRQMARAGFWLNLTSVPLVTLAAYTLGPLLGLDLRAAAP